MVELPIPKSYSYGGATYIEFSLGSTAPSWAAFDNDKNTVVVNTSAIPVMTEYSFELKSKVGPWSCEYSQTITIRVEHCDAIKLGKYCLDCISHDITQ
jgi:hypothetical protein